MNHPAVAFALLAVAALGAHAQSKLGAYSGTFEVTGTERDPKVGYTASVKVSLPLSKRDAGRIEAELLAGEAPPAMVTVTRWDYFHREKSADSSGHFAETTCKLAAAVEVPAFVTGVVNVDLGAAPWARSSRRGT